MDKIYKKRKRKKREGFGLYARQPRKNLHTGNAPTSNGTTNHFSQAFDVK